MNTIELLYPDATFHIYNHAVGRDNLFELDEDYRFFLKKYVQYVAPVVDTFAYCLMPNHFHLVIRVKSEADLLSFFWTNGSRTQKELLRKLGGDDSPPDTIAHTLALQVSQQFSNLFNAYAQTFNRLRSRRGNLFEQKFRRKMVGDTAYFIRLIHYVHSNPVHHGFTGSMGLWAYSSYSGLLSDKPSLLCRSEVLTYFGGKENFVYVHRSVADVYSEREQEEGSKDVGSTPSFWGD